MAHGAAGREKSGPNVCLISRQRIVGKTTGSSAYVLGIVGYLKERGCSVHYVSPSPATFGRWPWIRLLKDMDVFESIRIRGSVKLGRFLLVLDPTVMARAAIAFADHLLTRSGITSRRLSRAAPYSVGVPLSAPDAEFLARTVPALADILILDYAFLTPCIDHTKRRGVKTVVIMHDLFSARMPQFRNLALEDTVASISEAEEMALLSRADLVVAIQEDEAAKVRERLPGKRVIVAPIAVHTEPQPHAGDDDTLLFVGSNTAPNVDALKWFIDDVWPAIRAKRPSAELLVAGSVAWAGSMRAPGVTFLGVVGDLGALYCRAGVVISPLRVGSGLKIKLIEAMGWGKAVVATSITTQGVRPLVEDAIAVADTPEAFATVTAALMGNMGLRARYGAAALRAASAHFREDACYRGILDFVRNHAQSPQEAASIEVGAVKAVSAE